MNFIDVFQELISDRKTDIQEISAITEIEDSVIYDYMHGSYPNIEHAVNLANYFNCSLNYLMGLDDKEKMTKFEKTYDIKVFPSRYAYLLNKNNVTHYKICKEKKLNYSSYYSWKRGSIPSMKSLMIIAEYLGTSIDYLVGRTTFEY